MTQAPSRSGSLWVRPLGTALVLGLAVSAVASGRFSLRLIVDGALSFAFVPAFDLAALAIVCRTGRRARQPLAQTVDRYFAGNTAWLVWLTLVAALFAVLPPRTSGPWLKPALWSGLLPLSWCSRVDFRFWSDAMQRDARGALQDVVLHRLVGWSTMLTCFFGIAVWHEYVPQLRDWFSR